MKPTLIASLLFLTPLTAAEPTREEVAAAMKKAATFYREKVASHGGYVYYSSEDLKERWGEGKADADTLFVQPPGTPTVGMAFLKAYGATKDKFYLDAALDAGKALAYGQLQSGGWTQTIHFGPAKRAGKYRNGKGGSWNASSLDDDQTQAALRFLMQLDQALDFKNAEIHDAAEYGLKALLKAQFPNGAFPQIWTGPVAEHPIVKAKYPEHDGKTEGRVKNYWDYYTLNDGLAGSVAEVLIEAHSIYKDDTYKKALAKLGDFLILAQMPEPQPGWCQQYDYAMNPIWARKFEPAAITGWESQDAMRTLITIARVTGEKKYLEPIPKALEYFKKCVLSDGKVARFYELKTNKPLYMDGAYKLTYDDSAVPGHYGWKQPAGFDRIERELKAGAEPVAKPKMTAVQAKAILLLLDDQGRWVSTYDGERLVGQPKFPMGFRFISSAVFSNNLELLADWLGSSAKTH
jgi:hypothetical protein